MIEEYASYDYKKIDIKDSQDYKYLDALKSFRWEIDHEKSRDHNIYVLKRKRQLTNKIELLRLEHNFDACRNEISRLQKSIHSYATLASGIVAFIGTTFMTLSTFSVVCEPPKITLCVLFAIPGFIGWITPYFIYKFYKKKRTKEIQPFVEEKESEIDKICNKAMQLMH